MSLHQVVIAADRLLNAFLGGYSGEMLSARAYRCRNEPQWEKWMRRINRLFRDPMHCYDAYQTELEHRYMPAEYRGGE